MLGRPSFWFLFLGRARKRDLLPGNPRPANLNRIYAAGLKCIPIRFCSNLRCHRKRLNRSETLGQRFACERQIVVRLQV